MLKLSSLAIFNAFLFLVMALPALFAPESARKRILKMAAKLPNIQMFGFFSFILAFLILVVYAKFEKSWATVMSVLGYLYLIRGIACVWWPKCVKGRVKKIAKSESGPALIGLITLAIGIFLGYLGYYIF